MKLHTQQQLHDMRKGRRLHMEAPIGVAIASGRWSLFIRHPQFQGTVQDASIDGFHIRVEREIPAGATVFLWIQVQVGTRCRTLRLSGDIVRCEPHRVPGSFLVGVELRDRPAGAVKTWQAVMFDEIRQHASNE